LFFFSDFCVAYVWEGKAFYSTVCIQDDNNNNNKQHLEHSTATAGKT
jgi:hypothetical protein